MDPVLPVPVFFSACSPKCGGIALMNDETVDSKISCLFDIIARIRLIFVRYLS